jgi:D-alanyl-D-alanine carboxypeptidase (penicillin-binding protein 5/6)
LKVRCWYYLRIMLSASLKRSFLPLMVILAGFLIFLYTRPVPAVSPVNQIISIPKTQAISLPWPAGGQSALGAVGYGVLDSHNPQTPVPVASIAKIITALAVLSKKPLASGAQGPTITFDDTDLGFFNYYYQKDGSVAQVSAGEKLTELQALQAMLLPSANNMADSLARWAFGSLDAYVAYANTVVKNIGLTQTTVADASGFTDNTTSTATDLVKLGIAAMNDPAIAQVVAQGSADIPVAGTVKNVNWLLGQDGVVGIKTGNTDHAGGCYLFAAKRSVGGQSFTLVGAILALPQLNDAISAADPIIKAADNGFERLTVIHKGQVMAGYQAPWGQAAQATAGSDVYLWSWKGQEIKLSNEPLAIITPAASGSTVGRVSAQTGQQTAGTPLLLTHSLPGPSWHWRIFRK